MRVKQKEILKQKPDFEYSRAVNGKLAIVQGFRRPTNCVNIISIEPGTKPVAHCYVISDEAYKIYSEEAKDFYFPNRAKYEQLCAEWHQKAHATTDQDLKVFYSNVAECYRLRGS